MPPQQQSDPWQEAAKNFKPQADSGGASKSNDADWKVWQDNSETEKPSAQPGNAFTSGHPWDTIKANYEGALNPEGGLAHQFGRGATETLVSPLVHPLDTIGGVVKGLMHLSPGDPDDPIGKMAAETAQDYKDNGASKATAHLLGQGVGMGIGGELGGEGAGLVSRMAKPLGGAMERGGMGVINHALEVTPKMMKYGQNPARGLVDEGLTPSLSKFSLANKLDSALPQAGQDISSAVHNSPFTIPKANIARSIEEPIMNTGDVMSGFGGRPTSVDPIADLWASTERTAPGASQPIYGDGAPSDVPAPDLWHSIRNLDKNTRFNPDPEIEGVNEVRRDMRGGLRNDLEQAVPDLKPLSQKYGDLRTADDALSRTAGRGSGLKSAKDMLMFPTETAGGTALVKGGRMMQVPINPVASRAASSLFSVPRKENQ